ncbi:MAG: hypothetical protein ACJASF_002435 [Vicingaceae bacterium]|jgi:hypothetical protein
MKVPWLACFFLITLSHHSCKFVYQTNRYTGNEIYGSVCGTGENDPNRRTEAN